MKGLSADCRHAVRLYARTPGASLIAIGVLAVGLAFVGAFLSLYVDLVLRPHPGFEQSSRLATIGQNSGTVFLGVPFEMFERIADDMTSIEAAAMLGSASTLVGSEREEVIIGLLSREFFSGLRPRVALGRGFRVEDHAPDAEPVVVLSYRYWQQRFGGDRDAIGTFLEITRNPGALPYRGPPGSIFSQEQAEQDTAQFRIVGVMADTMQGFPTPVGGSFEPPMWVPLERVWPMFVGVPESLSASSGTSYVRRAPGVSATAVANELRARYGGSDSSWNTIPGARFDAIDGIVGDPIVQRDARRQLEMFIAGSVLLALVAAANVSLFLLARAPGRQRELGVRMAVGAPIRRLARQLATEAGLLVLVAAALGLLGSIWLSVYVTSLALFREAQWRDVTLLDWRVLSLTGAVVLLLALLVSLAPILGLKRFGIAASSRQATARASLPQRLAGTAQIAVAGTLAGAAIAFGLHVGALMFGDPGYHISDRYVVTFSRFMPMQAQLPAGNLTERDFIERALIEAARRREVIEAIPGVTAAAFGGPVPGHRFATQFPVQMSDPNDSANEVEVYIGQLNRAFIDVLGLTLLHGRAPETFEPGVVLVNQALARALFGRDDVIGERVPGHSRWGRDGAQIVGVLRDLSFEHPAATVKPFVFSTGDTLTAVVEARLTAAGLHLAFERLVSDGVIDVQIAAIEPLRGLRNELIAPDRARGALIIATATLVLLLAGFGFYGTQRYLVAAGRREYAIRASIGAGPGALGRLVFSRGLLLSLPGLVTGGLLAFIAVAWLRDDFVSREISPAVVTLWVIAGLTLLVLAASLTPAREARRTQPAPWLREE